MCWIVSNQLLIKKLLGMEIWFQHLCSGIGGPKTGWLLATNTLDSPERYVAARRVRCEVLQHALSTLDSPLQCSLFYSKTANEKRHFRSAAILLFSPVFIA